jgi:hypothetical protein
MMKMIKKRKYFNIALPPEFFGAGLELEPDEPIEQ